MQAKISMWRFFTPYQGFKNLIRDSKSTIVPASFAKANRHMSGIINPSGISSGSTLCVVHNRIEVSFLHFLRAMVRKAIHSQSNSVYLTDNVSIKGSRLINSGSSF